MTESAATPRPQPDQAEILRAASLFLNGVTELRSPTKRETTSGYYSNPGRLAHDAAALNRTGRNVYFIFNEIKPELLARRNNRCEPYAKTTTQDGDVIRRRYIVIDLDPVRPADISSSDAEKKAAEQTAKRIYAFLAKELEFPPLGVADSGNGWHLILKVDLPNDEASERLVSDCLEVLNFRFSDDRVSVDTTLSNASRIIKLYGSVSVKGDHTPERPHRVSRIIAVPKPFEAVPTVKLRRLAAMLPKVTRPAAYKANGHHRTADVKLAEWIGGRGLSVHHEGPYNGRLGRGWRWILESCPVNPDHTDRSAYLIQFDAGGIAAGCHHNGCKWNWTELRDKLEPGWRDRKGKRKRRGKGNGQSAPRDPSQPPGDSPDGETDSDEGGGSMLPEIVIGFDERRASDEAIAALATGPAVFQRGGELVQVIEIQKPRKGFKGIEGTPAIVPIRPPRLRELLTDEAVFVQENGESLERVRPPAWLVNAIHCRGQWAAIRLLEGIVEAPAFLPDGSILQTPGYHAGAGLLYVPTATFPPVPESPTADDIHGAIALLHEVVADFPFETPKHQAAWLAAVLTSLSRHAFDSPAPAFAVDANAAAAGKGLLCDTVGIIATGRKLPRMANPKTDDEFRKQITSVCLAGINHVLIDNISGTFGTPSFDAALTATTWRDRVLQESRMTPELPLAVTWFLTGNNLVFRGDIVRRICHIRLESLVERPEERRGFRHPNLLGWIGTERGRIVSAALTLLRAFHQAGRPDHRLKPWGSFEAWSDLVRNCIVWAGMEDPGATRQELREKGDGDRTVLAQLLEGWSRLASTPFEALTTADTVAIIESYSNGGAMTAEQAEGCEILRPLIREITRTKPGDEVSSVSLGAKLRSFRRRVVGGKFFDSVDDLHKKVCRWYVATAGDAGDAGDAIGQPGFGENDDSECAGKSHRTKTSPASPPTPATHDGRGNSNGAGNGAEAGSNSSNRNSSSSNGNRKPNPEECPACREGKRVRERTQHGVREVCPQCKKFWGYVRASETEGATL